MLNDDLDWVRLQKALSVEAERGYSDLVGNQYRFSEFLCLSLGKLPKNITNSDRIQWSNLAKSYTGYPQLNHNFYT